MATKSKQKKWTPKQINEHIQNIAKAVEQHRRDKKGDFFTYATPEEIERKLKRVNSPMIVSQVGSWTGATPPGGTFNYSVGIYNPDATQAIWLFAHVWIGSGNVDPTVGTFLLNVDSRFPRLTLPRFAGLSIAPSAFATLTFSLTVPAAVERTNYLGNTCLMRFNWHDVGTYLDRSVFVFEVA